MEIEEYRKIYIEESYSIIILKMVEKKVFVLDSQGVGKIIEDIYSVAKTLELEIKVRSSEEEQCRNLPKDFDYYILHISNIDEADLKRLKEKQSFSYFFGITGCGDELPNDLSNLFDDVYSSINKRDLEIILQKEWKPPNY